uniref:Syntaxin-22 n=1 Tax=Rhizophora mucronata TaxID=61149 RepID=A0A2P2JBD4_RHIMU
MSFQDLEAQSGKSRSSISSAVASSVSKSPSQAVAAGIFQINTAVSAFRRLVDAIGTAKDTPDHRLKLHIARQRILQLVKDTSAKLKSLSELDRHSNVNASKKVEDAKLARDFQTTLEQFQQVQQLASERESTYSPSASPAAASSSDSSQYAESGVDRDKQPLLLEQRRQEVLRLDNEIAFNEAIIEEREQGIRDIEEQIAKANDIFKDLAVLVHDQGVVIDDIQSSINSSAAATTQATVQLAKASKNVKSRSSWCWWILVIVVLALVIFLLVLIL